MSIWKCFNWCLNQPEINDLQTEIKSETGRKSKLMKNNKIKENLNFSDNANLTDAEIERNYNQMVNYNNINKSKQKNNKFINNSISNRNESQNYNMLNKNNEDKLNIQQYQQKIKELTSKNSQYEQIINQYKQKINELTLNLKKLQNEKMNKYNQNNNSQNEQITKLNAIINNLQNEINRLKNKIPIIRGLNNIGATCYMNATLQCLSNTKKLTDFFLVKYVDKPNSIMTNEYHKLITNLYDLKKNNTPYSPYSFKEVLSKENKLFEGIAANDSKDLINFLLERFHLDLNKANIINNNMIINQQDQMNEQKMLNLFLQDFKEKYNSPISHWFYGVMETKSQCHGCQTIKYNFQVYSFLEFPLQEVNKYYFNKGIRPLFTKSGGNPDVDLYECFDYYGKIDLMNGDNQMYCNICKRTCDAFYSTLIYSSPVYLIINLNRGKGAIYECKVNFPEQLNIFNYVTYKNGITVFELYGVICHCGPSSMSGHFIAFCKNFQDNKWYLYNDGAVTKCTRDYQYQENMPYILFYKALTSSS